jgi:hypothetical protein
MPFHIKKSFLYQCLFVFCVAVPYLNNYELTFFVWGFTAFITISRKYSLGVLKQVFLFCIIAATAFFSSLFNDFLVYNFIRDITYMIKPIIGILVGYQLCKNKLENPIKLVVNTGVFLAVLHLLIVAYGVVFVGFRNIHQIRGFAGFFSDYEVYVIIILLFSKEFQLEIKRNRRYLYLLILIISAAFYLSRTNFIQFGILFLAMKGYFVVNRRNVSILASFLIVGLLAYSAVLYYNPKRNGKGIEAFLYKVKIAPTEPFKTKINREDYKDFNDNYRSVENITTLAQMEYDGTFTMLFGKGMGSTVDLKREVWLDDTLLRYISVLHNGFMTVYLKSGIFGVLCLMLSIIILFRKQKTNIPLQININNLITGTAIFLFISYWVFMGFYFKADTKIIILGLLLALSEKNVKKQLETK